MREFWSASCNYSKYNPNIVQPDVQTCWIDGCNELAVATYVDRNMLGHKYCLDHIVKYYTHLTEGNSYCTHRVPHSWYLWEITDMRLGMQNLPFCLPIGKCKYYPRGLGNYERSDADTTRMRWNYENGIYHNCGCSPDGHAIEGYLCCYADITDPEREKRRAELRAKYAKKFSQLSLFGGKK